MVHLREEDEDEGRMTKEWADEYSEEHGFHQYTDNEPRRCQNPHCGHYPIFSCYILRNTMSGDVKEIGSYCKQRWNKLQGLATEPWFDEYNKNLILAASQRPERRLTSPEMKEISREARKKYLIKRAEEGEICFERLATPLQNFRTKNEAEKYAEEHEGYLEREEEGKWILYIRREETQRDKVLKLVRKEGLILSCEDHPLQDFSDETHAEKYAEEHGGYSEGKLKTGRGTIWRGYINPHYDRSNVEY